MISGDGNTVVRVVDVQPASVQVMTAMEYSHHLSDHSWGVNTALFFHRHFFRPNDIHQHID